MNVVFKTKDRVIITGADCDEKLLLKEFIANANLTTKTVVITALTDINGEETGLSIELVDKTTNNTVSG